MNRWTAVFLCCLCFCAGSVYATVVGHILRAGHQ